MRDAASRASGSSADSGLAARTLPLAVLEEWGGDVGRQAASLGLFVALYGPLGAGKSTLVRAACRGVGIEGPIPSPTYTILHQYVTESGDRVGHADLYRIDSEAQLLDLGWDELLAQEQTLFVEWADRAVGHLPSSRWDIRLDTGSDPNRRVVRVAAVGDAPSPPSLPTTC